MDLTLISNSDSFKDWEQDWIFSLFPSYTNLKLITDQTYSCVDGPNPIVILSGPLNHIKSHVSAWFDKFPKPPILIHLSDEFCVGPVDFYPKCYSVFRNYYRPDVATKAKYLPLGYKSGFLKDIQNLKTSQRNLMWSFIGSLKGTRYDMLNNAQSIPGGFYYLADGFLPTNISTPLPVSDYAQVLNNSIFALCPKGNKSMDTFRLYEALEAGCIPIVEDTDNYFLTIYLDFPCPRLKDWNNLRKMMAEVECLLPEHLEQTRQTIQYWWSVYKYNLKNEFEVTLRNYVHL